MCCCLRTRVQHSMCCCLRTRVQHSMCCCLRTRVQHSMCCCLRTRVQHSMCCCFPTQYVLLFEDTSPTQYVFLYKKLKTYLLFLKTIMDYPLAVIGGFLCLCGFMMLILLFLLSIDRRYRWFERTSDNIQTTEQVKEETPVEIKQVVAKVVYQPDPEDLIAIAIQ